MNAKSKLLNSLMAKKADVRKLESEIETIELELRKIRNAERKTIKVTDRKGSTILSREDGLSIVVSKSKNTHGEVKVHWYNGKKGELIDGYSRAYLDAWKDFLVAQ